MLKTMLTTASLFILGCAPALAHPGHADQSIHWSEWLATAVLLSAIGGVALARRAARRRQDRH
ncbi:hypothetical protein [Denitromonas sp.]|uniref:hypothetical protein n=1 Tax=Denitromonas sp. TaxID=2734609 RepID=UPI0013BC5970|nr:hypothetical protein [Denitromonas sp.]KAA3654012.1 MAG: hypothetical protein DWQ11_05840 [Pseudomonadota bacterium]